MDLVAILAVVQSHALSSGLFERVNGHEPLSAPGHGLSAAVWTDSVAPVKSSGLATSSGRLALFVRLYSNVVQEPQDAIDPLMVAAVDTLLTTYSGDFDLGSNVRCVDLLGAYGTALSAQAGYLEQDGAVYRVMTITLPLILNDLWAQVA